MKLAYVICTLLCITLVLADNDALHLTDTTTAEPIIPSNSVADTSKTVTVSDSNNITNGTTTPVPPNTTKPANITTSTTTTTTTTSTTTTTTPSTTTTTTTTAATTTPTPNNHTTPTTPTKPTTVPSPTAAPTSTASSATTAVPPSPSSKDRQFDGLSFFGGIILTTCLMAIAAFSWKFYRQCKEGNYRTL
ncbi:integumentary mucin C.1 [Solenopsis invicta]|uniref:integumentary mucin C.1 n=1 Tax=Solenopsis invicta TaxID=13686 RepID=UPI00193DAFF5|nr:integumentary mucin C.1 [Solenopsis invicta]